ASLAIITTVVSAWSFLPTYMDLLAMRKRWSGDVLNARGKGMELHLGNLTRTLIKPAESKPRASSLSKPAHKHAKNEFSKSEVKKWAIDDINKTISWLDN
nr:hypothetical protein [Tanacetum cinerariifolium]